MADQHALGGLILAGPGFELEGSTHRLALPAPKPVPGLLSARPSRAARTNLVLERRRIEEGISFEALIESIGADLAQALPEMQDLHSEAFEFSDGHRGALMSYRFSYRDGLPMEQRQALRIDDGWLSILVLTTPSPLELREQDKLLSVLRSARPESP